MHKTALTRIVMRALSVSTKSVLSRLAWRWNVRRIQPVRMVIAIPWIAVAEALNYKMEDLRRIERMVLERVAGEFFRTHEPQKGDVHE